MCCNRGKLSIKQCTTQFGQGRACGCAGLRKRSSQRTHCVQSRPRNTKRPSFRNFTIAFGKLVQADKRFTPILVTTPTGAGFCMLLASALALHPIALSVQPKPFSLIRVTTQSRLKRSVSASSRPRRDNLQALCRPQRLTQPAVTRQDSPELWHLILAATVASPLSASAAEINYTPGQGADVVKNIGGLAYVGLLAFWLFKVVGRRIKRSTTERLASQQEKEVDEIDVADVPVSTGAAFLGAVQASFFTYLLFLFSNSISGYFSQQGLPDNYTARNMSVTFRTAIAGLAYLATFIFGANAAGLTVLASADFISAGLTLKLLISPEKGPTPAKDTGKQDQNE